MADTGAGSAKVKKENNWPKEKKKKKNNNNIDKLKASVIEHGQEHESTLDVHSTDEENCCIWQDSKPELLSSGM